MEVVGEGKSSIVDGATVAVPIEGEAAAKNAALGKWPACAWQGTLTRKITNQGGIERRAA